MHASGEDAGPHDADEGVLFVGDLGYKVTDEILANAFRQFGNVERAYVIRNSKKQSLGYGFVHYKSAIQATQVLQVTAETGYFYIGGSPRPVIVEPAETKAARARRPPVNGDSACEDPLSKCSTSAHQPDVDKSQQKASKARRFEFVEPDPSSLEGQYALKLKELLEHQQREVEQLKQDHLDEQRDMEDQQFAKIKQDLDHTEQLREISQMIFNIDRKQYARYRQYN
eukprot:CAMPEP_0118938254 /NCGR_PEP_ID=MMETSP1169-20130426/25255_1 /TAXON_ID=36882 /ORGANISM="Pyramimonas obovata, Strain CCMP722" /LENGTH=226 /DNA_ID=CAMNT_0006882137 /DNA_START=139 /DNA_END=819 /DNA_ORIENTATION=-